MRSAIAVACTALLVAAGAHAQDFDLPAPEPMGSVAAPLEQALPRAAPGVTLAAGTIAWYGAPGLVTRALIADAGRGPWRLAAGLSQTGDPEVGWTTLALGVGAAGADWGAGLRVLARRDRQSAFSARFEPGEGGLESGAGAWLALGGGAVLWASAPSLAVTGAAPPLARALETGLGWRDGDLALWLAHRSAPAGYGAASVAAGACATAGPARLWLDAHDAPLAGGFGVAFRREPLEVSAAVESHPWLPPLTRLAVALGGAGP